MSDDLAPPPDDVIEIQRSPVGHGWMVKFDGQPQAFFSTAEDMASWLKTVLTPLDIEAGVVPAPTPEQPAETLPRILHEDPARMIEPKPARLWRVFIGGRT